MRRRACWVVGLALVVGTLVAITFAAPGAGEVEQAIRATVIRYGAVWVALGGVVLLGLGLVWRQDAPRRRASAIQPTPRPRLTLVTSEPRP